MTRNRLTSAAQTKAFALAGNSTLTLVSTSTGTRFTFKVQAPMNADKTARDLDADIRFVKVLTGADNENSYSYLGFVRRDVFSHGGAKAKVGFAAPSARAFAWAWQQFVQDRLPEALEVWHEGSCGRCGRKLTVPTSIASGFGPECIDKVGFICD
jgi:hypothetical protein